MTICAITVCRNYKGRLKTTTNVTYHRIPNDPNLRHKWIEIIRKSRGEDCWQPAKTTVICSDHFRAKDLHFGNNEKRRRLKKKAIPCKALFLASLQNDDDDESNDSVEDRECVTHNLNDIVISLESNKTESCGVTLENHNETSFVASSENIKASGSTTSPIPGQPSGSKIGDELRTESDGEIVEDWSDLDSVCDSPRTSKIRLELRRRIRLQNKHTLKIQSLRRKNIRLKKKIAAFKKIIEKLKNEKYNNNRQ